MVVKVRLKNVPLLGRVNLVRGWFYNKLIRPRKEKAQEKLTSTQLRKMLQGFKSIIETIDEGLLPLMNRGERKQFWSDFCKHGTMREDVFSSLIKNEDVQKLVEEYNASSYKGSKSKKRK